MHICVDREGMCVWGGVYGVNINILVHREATDVVPGGVPRTPAYVRSTPVRPSMGGSTLMHPSMGGGRVSLLAGLRYCCALGADRCLGDPPPPKPTPTHPPWGVALSYRSSS